MKKVILFLVVLGSFYANYSVQADQREVLISRDDFDNPNIETIDWHVTKDAGANVIAHDDLSYLELMTDTGAQSEGSAVVTGTKGFAVPSSGALVFKSRLHAYVDSAVYGDGQPRGLVFGSDRSNAIEFVSATPNSVACRTVRNGKASETVVPIGQYNSEWAVYQIIATRERANFYINGKLVASQKKNIPLKALNVYFSTSDGGAGNVPVVVDYVSFERILQ